jgi:hypothetical protein
MRNYFFGLTLFSLLLFAGCSDDNAHAPAGKYAWLIGTWTTEFKGNPMIEIWAVDAGGALSGSNVVIDTKGDTLLVEPIKIYRKDSVDYLSMTMPGKNGSTELLLKFTASTEKSFTAVKASATDGLTISYTMVDKDHFTSVHQSTSKESPWTEEFEWQRLK